MVRSAPDSLGVTTTATTGRTITTSKATVAAPMPLNPLRRPARVRPPPDLIASLSFRRVPLPTFIGAASSC